MRHAFAAAIVLLLTAVPAMAQSFELGGLVGFTPSASLERTAPQFESTSIDGGLTFGINATAFLSDHWGIEGEWIQQFSGFAFEMGDDGPDESIRLYDINVAHVHGYGVYRLGDPAAKLRPFVFGGGGITLFSASDLETETKLSFGMGGGLVYAISNSIAIEGRVVYRPIMMNDSDAGDFCDAFGYCQSTLQQFDFLGGVKIRF